ncbi:MAG: hypothetical protein GSR76_02735 [Desulfurococcales archaeon]|nr:hypothetical protein [Desulfurococcales archaeon]
MKYSIKTSTGGFVDIEEKNSILITIGMVIMGLISIGLLAWGVLIYNEAPGLALSLIGGSILAGIYAAILSHLKHKADMDPGEASILSVTGGSVRVWKDSSIWISLLLGLVYLGIVASLIALGYGLLVYKQAPGTAGQLVYMGILGLVGGGILAKILGFLRTRLNFKGDKVIALDVNGGNVELYKDRSVWLTIGFAVTILAGLALTAIPVLQAMGAVSLNYGSLTGNALDTEIHGSSLESIQEYAGPASMLVTGLVLLVNAAVLNFLSVRVQIRRAGM